MKKTIIHSTVHVAFVAVMLYVSLAAGFAITAGIFTLFYKRRPYLLVKIQ